MRLVTILIVTAALALAATVFFVVPRLMNRGKQQADQQQVAAARLPAQNVLVASHGLPAGIILKADDLRWQGWPEDAIDPSFLVEEKGADAQRDAVGRIVLRGIEQGEPVTALRLLKPGDTSFLAAALAPGMRAVSIKIDVVSGAGGFIMPQSRVDVLLAERYPVAPANAGDPTVPQVTSKDAISVILRNVTVLAIDQGVQDIDSKPKIGATATLEVDLQQAEKLALAGQMGTLTLVLRSQAEPAQPEPTTTNPIIEDFQVSPFRASVLRQAYGNRGGTPPGSDGGLRVYHGTALLGPGQ